MPAAGTPRTQGRAPWIMDPSRNRQAYLGTEPRGRTCRPIMGPPAWHSFRLQRTSGSAPTHEDNSPHLRSWRAGTGIGKRLSTRGSLPIIYIAFPPSQPKWVARGLCPGNICAPNKQRRKSDVEIWIRSWFLTKGAARPPCRLTSAGNTKQLRLRVSPAGVKLTAPTHSIHKCQAGETETVLQSTTGLPS